MLVFILTSDLVADQLDKEYSKEFTGLIEAVYGSGLLSQGGFESIELMLEGEDLAGKKILDVGSGLGGVDFYLAQKYAVDVVGIDRVSRLVDEANAKKGNYELLGNVTFSHQETESDLSRYADESFDIVFSKETLLHVLDKESLLKEFFRVLKPGGKLITLDWLNAENKPLGPIIQEMLALDGLSLTMLPLTEYKKHLERAGFKQIVTLALNQKFIGYTKKNIETIHAKQAELKEHFGDETFNYSLKSWGLQKTVFENEEVVVTLLKAIKPD